MKIIIHTDESVSELESLEAVSNIIRGGRISNYGNCYCYCTLFKSGITVLSARTKTGTDVFNVWKTA